MLILLAGSGSGMAGEAGRHTYEFAGLSVLINPSVGSELGYDSNLDGAPVARGSKFEKLEVGLDIEAKRAGDKYWLNLNGRDFHFDDLDRAHRWDVETDLGATIDVAEKTALTLESEYIRDFYPRYSANIFVNRADLEHADESVIWKLRARSVIEQSLNGAPATDFDGDFDNSGVGDEDALTELLSGLEHTSEDARDTGEDYLSAPRSKEYDYARSEGQISVMFNQSGSIQPFVIADYASLDYFSQPPLTLTDRNAREEYAIVGIRLKSSKDLWIDLGGRTNHRDFDDERVDTFSSSGLDVRLHWQAADRITITGRVERFIREPTTLAALADDVEAYGLTLDWKLAEALKLSAKGSYDIIGGIGDDIVHDKLYGRLELIYEPCSELEVFANVLGRYVEEQKTGSEVNRYRVGGGLNLKF